MPDPVSWKVVEHGWTVATADGDEVGRVAEVLGDPNIDIFNGLAVSTGLLGKSRYVPSERVGRIVEGRVELELSKADFERLPEPEQRPS